MRASRPIGNACVSTLAGPAWPIDIGCDTRFSTDPVGTGYPDIADGDWVGVNRHASMRNLFAYLPFPNTEIAVRCPGDCAFSQGPPVYLNYDSQYAGWSGICAAYMNEFGLRGGVFRCERDLRGHSPLRRARRVRREYDQCSCFPSPYEDNSNGVIGAEYPSPPRTPHPAARPRAPACPRASCPCCAVCQNNNNNSGEAPTIRTADVARDGRWRNHTDAVSLWIARHRNASGLARRVPSLRDRRDFAFNTSVPCAGAGLVPTFTVDSYNFELVGATRRVRRRPTLSANRATPAKV